MAMVYVPLTDDECSAIEHALQELATRQDGKSVTLTESAHELRSLASEIAGERLRAVENEK